MNVSLSNKIILFPATLNFLHFPVLKHEKYFVYSLELQPVRRNKKQSSIIKSMWKEWISFVKFAFRFNYFLLLHYFNINTMQQVITVLFSFKTCKGTVFLFSYKETYSGTNKIGAICDGHGFTTSFGKHRKWRESSRGFICFYCLRSHGKIAVLFNFAMNVSIRYQDQLW